MGGDNVSYFTLAHWVCKGLQRRFWPTCAREALAERRRLISEV